MSFTIRRVLRWPWFQLIRWARDVMISQVAHGLRFQPVNVVLWELVMENAHQWINNPLEQIPYSGDEIRRMLKQVKREAAEPVCGLDSSGGCLIHIVQDRAQ